MGSLKEKLKKLIRDDELEEAFSLFEDQVPVAIADGLGFILIKNNFNELKKKEREHRITESDKSVIKRQLIKDFVNLIEDVFKNFNLGDESGELEKNINALFKDKSLRRFPEKRLIDLYVDPFFSVSKKNYYVFNKKPLVELKGDFYPLNEPLSIHSYINNFFLKGESISGSHEKPPGLLLIFGYPGQGKTSLCEKVINDIVRDESAALDLGIWYLKLADILPGEIDGLFNNSFEFLGAKSRKFKNQHSGKILLILDGLNEIDVEDQLGLSQKEIENLIRKFSSEVREERFYKIILTCRLYFFDSMMLNKSHVLTIRMDSLNLSQQLKWLNGFPSLDEAFKKELIKINNREKGSLSFFERIIGVPAVLEIFVELFPKFVDGGNKRAFIYEFLEELYKRSWEDRGQFDRLHYLQPSVLVLLNKTIAKLVKKSKSASIKISELVKEEELFIYLKKFYKIEIASEIILRDIITSFFFDDIYFGQKEDTESHEREFEFTFMNDSLREWFYAEYVFGNLNDNLQDFSGSESGYNDNNRAALKLIWESFVEVPITEEIFKNLIELTKVNLFKSETIDRLKKRLIEHFPRFMKYDLLYEYHSSDYFPPPCPVEMCLNGFYYFWHFIKFLSNEETIVASEESLIDKKNKIQEESIKLSVAEEDKIALLSNFCKLLRIEKVVNGRPFNLSYQDFSGSSFERLVFREDNLCNTRFLSAKFGKTDFHSCQIDSVDFCGSSFLESRFFGSDIDKSNFSHANLSESIFNEIQIKDSDFIEANLEKTFFIQVHLIRVNFEAANLKSSDIRGAIVQDVNFGLADLSYSKLDFLDLSKINFYGAHLEKSEMREVKINGANFEKAYLFGADLSGSEMDLNTTFKDADLQDAIMVNIRGVSNSELAEKLSKAKSLAGITIKRMKFQKINFFKDKVLSGSDLSYCDFSGSDLSYCDFSGSDLSYCDFSGANLEGAILENSNLRGVSFSSATNVENASFKSAYLLEIKGLGDEDLIKVLTKAKTLFQIGGLSRKIIGEIEEKHPNLLSSDELNSEEF